MVTPLLGTVLIILEISLYSTTVCLLYLSLNVMSLLLFWILMCFHLEYLIFIKNLSKNAWL